MSELNIKFKDEDAKLDFISWLNNSGESSLSEYLYDRDLGELNLTFVDDDNIEAD